MKRIIRNRHRTPEEVEEDRKVRELIEKEKPELNAKFRHIIAERRKVKATDKGIQTLGGRIRMTREAKGMSQIRLAETAHISQGYLSQLEQDEREPSLSIATRIAHALDLSLDELAAHILS
ncbi:MAG: helix-turn-helix transcriptional regulator [Pirellulales bacterium]|nr:helix-turn-helix transcriptional regulator [Pirellulales bacterium]